MHLRKPKDGTDFRAGQDITKLDLIIKEDKIVAYFVM